MVMMAMMNSITKKTITAPITTIPIMATTTTVNSIATITPKKMLKDMGTIIKAILKYSERTRSISLATAMPMDTRTAITKVMNKTTSTLTPIKTITNTKTTQMNSEIVIHNQQTKAPLIIQAMLIYTTTSIMRNAMALITITKIMTMKKV